MNPSRNVRRTGYFVASTAALSFSLTTAVGAATYNYLEDADTSSTPNSRSGMPNIKGRDFPRVIMSEIKAFPTNREAFSKYPVIAGQAFQLRNVGRLQQDYPQILYYRMFTPREYLGYGNSFTCNQGHGIPFASTANATSGCSVYAGHWLYKAGSRTTQSLSASGNTVRVQDASRFNVGQYVVIYSGGPGAFNNAEHARISGRNVSNDTLTLSTRGYRSTARSHPSGAIIAQHVLGQGGGNPLNWAYNLSTACPRDANNRTIAEYMASWLPNNLTKDQNGRQRNARVDGLLFDVDYHFELRSKNSDVNNDLVVDHGISNNGTNLYGQGVDRFYQLMRNRFPDLVIVGGTRNARGFDHLNGVQMEGWPVSNGYMSPNPEYADVDALLAKYSYHVRRTAYGPQQVHVLSKTPTRTYPRDGSRPSSNRAFRFGFGLALLDNGYYGQENHPGTPDPWYDEYAVNVNQNSSSFGHAVPSNPNNESQTRASNGWLGQPLNLRQRLYDTSFAASNSLISNGTFESTANGWSGNNVSVSRVTGGSNSMDGNGGLRASTHNNYSEQPYGAKIQGPTTYLVRGEEYTLVFSAKADRERMIDAVVGGTTQRFIVGPNWLRRVMTFRANRTGNARVQFNVGRESTRVWIDTVHLFQGNANILRRDFENGTVVVNATPTARTVALGATFQRILGTQDPINDGSRLSSVRVAPYDAAILVRVGTNQGAPSTPPPSGPDPTPDTAACGAPNINAGSQKALYVWNDCGSNQWHIRATAGGAGSTQIYDGSLSSNQQLSGVQGLGLDQWDTLNQTSSTQLDFTFKIQNSGVDGLDFRFDSSARTCLDSSLPGGATVRLGSQATQIQLPFDLGSLSSCN